MKGLPLADRLLSVLGLTLLIGFCFPLVWTLQRWDLAICVGVVILMAAYDFWDETTRRVSGRRLVPDPHQQKDQI